MRRFLARRFILLVLLIIPVGLLVVSFTTNAYPEDMDLLFSVFGVPILVFNAWEWTEPEIFGKILGKGE